MGHGEWTRHLIINTQPKDAKVNQSVDRLSNKPIRDQKQQRLTYNFDQRSQIESDKNDKVYLVGHGGSSKLGGLPPEALADKVFEAVKNCPQVNIVMCGSSNSAAAKRFARHLCTELKYEGKVFAYSSPLTADEKGKSGARGTTLELNSWSWLRT